MELEQPKGPRELRYFSRKTVDGCKIKVWVFNPTCPKCKEGRLSIPYDEEKGRYKSMARNVFCNKCDYFILKKEFKAVEAIANVEYTCPHCRESGALQAPFKRTKKKVFKFKCGFCGKVIVVK